MSAERTHHEECWVSLILRVAIASLFVATSVGRFQKGMAGVEAVVGYFQSMFKDTWLPMPLVTLHAHLLPYIEALIPIWLIVGWRLRYAWVFTSLFMVTLAFGMTVVQKYDVAATNFLYVLICCWGLYFSRYDRLSVDQPGNKREA